MGWVWVLITAVRAVSPDPGDRWAATLADLDRVRATAFAAADPAPLRGVYAPRSSAGEADATTIARYRSRGARVVGAELRVVSCRVLAAGRTRVRLDVVDRLGPARVVWADGATTDLPRDEPSRRLITLARTPDGWRISGSRLR